MSYKIEKFEFKDYKTRMINFRNEVRSNPDKYNDKHNIGFEFESNGYTCLYHQYDLSEVGLMWVDNMIKWYILTRISNEEYVKYHQDKYFSECSFTYTDDNIGEVQGILLGTEGSDTYYLKDEDFDKLTFPEIPSEIPEYVYIKEYINDPEGFLEENPDVKLIFKKFKLGQKFIIDPKSKKVATLLDNKGGKLVFDIDGEDLD